MTPNAYLESEEAHLTEPCCSTEVQATADIPVLEQLRALRGVLEGAFVAFRCTRVHNAQSLAETLSILWNTQPLSS